MSAGSSVAGRDIREHYTPLPVGTVLWHVYPTQYEARAFNPYSRNRFALPPPPRRGMFYAGDSSDCALWEAVLRNLVFETRQPQHVDSALLEGRSIAQLRLNGGLNILDLRAPHFRHLSANSERQSEWQRLCVLPEDAYGQTHDAARELLTVAPKAAGLCWHSRQIAAQTAYVFYEPPVASTHFDIVEAGPLDRRWDLIDQALDAAGVERMDADKFAKELEEEFPDEDEL